MGKTGRPVKGDDQVIDIELDRHTELLPRRDDAWKVDWSISTEADSTTIDQKSKGTEALAGAEPG